MTLNEKKLDQMVEAVRNEFEGYFTAGHIYGIERSERLRTALTPFCMEMTDEEIEEAAIINNPQETNEYGHNLHSEAVLSVVRYGFIGGAKFIRDGK